jgi:hypothetical protein
MKGCIRQEMKALDWNYNENLPVEVRPENLFHSNYIGVKAQTSSNITDHNCDVTGRGPKV